MKRLLHLLALSLAASGCAFEAEDIGRAESALELPTITLPQWQTLPAGCENAPQTASAFELIEAPGLAALRDHRGFFCVDSTSALRADRELISRSLHSDPQPQPMAPVRSDPQPQPMDRAGSDPQPQPMRLPTQLGQLLSDPQPQPMDSSKP